MELLQILNIDPSQIDWDRIIEKAHNNNNQEIIRLAKKHPTASPQWIAKHISIPVSKDQVNKILRENGLHKKYDKTTRRDRTPQIERRKQVLASLEANPLATGVDIAKDLGVNRATVYEITRAEDFGINMRERNENARVVGLQNRYEDDKEKLRARVRTLFNNDNSITVGAISELTGITPSWIWQVLKKDKTDIDIDMVNQLQENGNNARKARLIAMPMKSRGAKRTKVIMPDGTELPLFDSLSDACRYLEKEYNCSFPAKSVGEYIKRGKAYKGFVFSYDCEDCFQEDE